MQPQGEYPGGAQLLAPNSFQPGSIRAVQPPHCAPPARRLPWMVVNTHRNRELVAIENLERQNFDAYCPMVRKRRSHGRCVTTVARPLFPNYLFVCTAADMNGWRPIQSTVGVRSLVRFGDAPALLEDWFIECLRRREVEGFVVLPTEPYKIGQRVRLEGSAFDGVVATILSVDERQSVVVLLEFLRRVVRAKVPFEQVKPAGTAVERHCRPLQRPT